MSLPVFAEAGLSWSAIGVILTAVLSVGGLLAAILLQHGSKLSAIKTAVEFLQQRSDEQRGDVKEIWDKVDNHEHRITVIEGPMGQNS